jgi:hypothetical protein
MRVLAICLLAAALTLFSAFLVSAAVFGNRRSQHNHHDVSSFNEDFIHTFNNFMCATNSKYCVKAGNIPWPTLRENVIRRGLEFTHEMLNPKSLTQRVVHHNLPKAVQDLFTIAKKHAHKHAVSAHAPELAHHKASAAAVIDAWKEITGNVKADQYAYFGWLPQWAGDAAVGSSTSFSTTCVGEITVAASLNGNTLTSTTTASKSGFLCDDMLLLLVGDAGYRLQVVDKDAPINWEIDVSNFTPEQKWYMSRHGVRVLKFPKGLIDTIGQLIATLTQLAGFAEMPLTNATLQANIQFLKDYVEASPRMQPLTEARLAGDIVANNPDVYTKIQSGDSFIVMRPDGLDPMIGWGEGWTSGHSTIAMRDANNTLYVCESTAQDAYWTTNGIQCTLYPQWIQRYTAAQQTVLHAPLKPEYRAQFNVDAAWAFFRQYDGVNYGYANFLFGWVDLQTGNFPCLPPDYKTCLMKEAVEQLAFIIDKLTGEDNTNIFRQAINHRTGTVGRSVLGAFYSAVQANPSLTLPEIYVLPEQDSWDYNMTCNNGTTIMAKASVCCVFVCRMWKAAGIFSEIGNEINCGEQTLWDIFSMGIYDTTQMGANRPQVCINADPKNELCQLVGPVSLYAKPDFNTRKLYKNMGEKCGSLAPDYVRAPGC